MTRTHALALAAAAGLAGAAQAQDAGLASTDRFGYGGTVERYDTLADAQAGTNQIDTISISDRDLSLFIGNNDTSVANQNLMLGSWWYTTDTNYGPNQGRAGFGNTHGNTGVGFLQMYDQDSSTDTNVEMSFDNFNGSEYTEYNLTVEGSNANRADDFSRLSAIDNVDDGGIWHDYALELTATGLDGQQIAPGVIESANHPTGVTGSITGIFEITEDEASPANQGFYTVGLDLNMDNWAYANRNDLTPMVSSDGGDTFFDGSFADSTFRTVPAPGSLALLGLGGLAGTRRRR